MLDDKKNGGLFKKLDNNTIESTKFLKEKDAIKQYSELAKDGAIVIRTK